MCRYGIEYVEDPATHKRIPTVNRAQYTSIFADEDYKSALEYADGYQREIYEQEARAIDEIQRGILAISQKEEPFDVFICYKETDNSGRRTPDSVLANDLYHQLTQEGFKVFFARITLEDKLGSAYEPYIFAALNSSKVMVVLGTKPEYFNAVWVKNEWSRYLALIKNGAKKMLIPAYRDMDPYDLPEEFSHLQAQDMSKLGFMQDLIRGIKKIVDIDEPKVIRETVISGSNATTAPMLKRAFMFLEDESWQEANEYCEKVLDLDPENAQAYLGKLLADLHIRTRAGLKECAVPFEENSNCQKAMRFGDDGLREELKECNEYIKERNENARNDREYLQATKEMDVACSEETYKSVANHFEQIENYKDSAILKNECLERAETCRKNNIYNSAKVQITYIDNAIKEKNVLINDSYIKNKCIQAIKAFESIPGWKDSDRKIEICKQKLEEINRIAEENRIATEKEQLRAKRLRKTMSIISISILAVILLSVILAAIFISKKVNEAKQQAFNNEFTKIAALDVGDTFYFGKYFYDSDTKEKKDIEWLILDKQDNKMLVISNCAILGKQFNSNFFDTSWEKCTLRKQLNHDFFNTAFSTYERNVVTDTNITAEKNPDFDTPPGNDTVDKLFLLSISEVEMYFPSNDSRRCITTPYAQSCGALASNGYGWWLLRTSGCDKKVVADVEYTGAISSYGTAVSYVHSVRPAMWIDISN